MSMKELKISELMDDYTDNEFCMEGETLVDNEELKGLVLEQAKTKRKVKPLFKVIAVAAVAVVAAATTMAATTAIGGKFRSAGGSEYWYEFKDGYTQAAMHPSDYESLLKEENGRLYLTVDGETTDVTDLIDRQTPYIYTCTNAESNIESGKVSYVIAGGTPDNYGVVDIAYIEGLGWWGGGAMNGDAENDMHVARFDNLNDEPPTQSYQLSYFLFYDAHGNPVQTRDENGSATAIFFHGAGREDGVITDSDIPSTWREDWDVAWLIEALVQLEIFEPDIFV